MRILIADRNARLLEAISRTFAQQFSIQTATTRKQCGELLRQGAFDLAIVSEKLADGRGLQLLAQIARSSPDTLRIFAARESRLQLLKGRLGPLGLFRTLAYPIDARILLSALTLARVRLEIELPQVAQPQHQVQRTALPRRAAARSVAPPRVASESETFRRALARREAAKRAASSQNISRSSWWGHQLAETRGGRTRSMALLPLASLSKLVRLVTATRSTHQPQLADSAPKRTMVMLGATMVVVFLVTTLALHSFGAADAPSLSAQATRTPRVGGFSAPRLVVERPENFAPPQRPVPAVAQRAEPKPDSTIPAEVAPDAPMAASNTPVADPSTFGSEAYEPIYSD
jgi:DNA-binding response OmpR family regulator